MTTEYREIRVRLSLSAEQMMAYYRGDALSVQARSVDGRWVRFPVKVLRAFTARDGIHGEFLLRYDSAGRFVDIRRV